MSYHDTKREAVLQARRDAIADCLASDEADLQGSRLIIHRDFGMRCEPDNEFCECAPLILSLYDVAEMSESEFLARVERYDQVN